VHLAELPRAVPQNVGNAGVAAVRQQIGNGQGQNDGFLGWMDSVRQLSGRCREVLTDRLLHLLFIHSEPRLPEAFDNGGRTGLIRRGILAGRGLPPHGAAENGEHYQKQNRPPRPAKPPDKRFGPVGRGCLDRNNHVPHSPTIIFAGAVPRDVKTRRAFCFCRGVLACSVDAAVGTGQHITVDGRLSPAQTWSGLTTRSPPILASKSAATSSTASDSL